MSSSTVSRARQQGGGGNGRQFPVGARRRYVPVVDSGCGCRPRRPRLLLLLSLPSFLKLGGSGKAAAVRRRGTSSSSSASTASFSSSSGAAARSTTGTGYSSSSAYSTSSDYYYHCCGGAAAATTKTKQQQQQQPEADLQKAVAASPARAPPVAGGKKQKKKRQESNNQMAEEDGGVGVAVEKESSDPRADFRDSMVQMIVETGLCDWDGLRCMLRRLLALNAPRHHAAILTAFAEVCAQIVATPSPAASPLHPSPSRSPAAYRQHRRRG